MKKLAKTSAERASEEYDNIASKYQEATEREFRKFTLEPMLTKYLGNLSGQSVLDLACGEGYSARLIRDKGASDITAIDVSKKEIEMAKQIENNLSIGKTRINYMVGDASGDLTRLGKYDLITAIMLLHYCDSLEMLERIILNVKNHLAKNGEFLAFIPNSDIATDYDNYGVKMYSETKKEGDKFETTLSDFNGNKFCSFTNYFWKKETYQKAFETKGLNIEWLDSFVSDEGLKKYGDVFWDDYNKRPTYSIFRAKINK